MMNIKFTPDDPEIDEMDFIGEADEGEARRFECLQLALHWASAHNQTCPHDAQNIVSCAARFEAYLKGSFNANTSN